MIREGLENQKTPNQIYQDWIHRHLATKLAGRKERAIPPEERHLEKLGDYGYRMRILPYDEIPASSLIQPDRDVNMRRTRYTEYFFDFDDTIFDTTGYEEAIKARLAQHGIPKEDADRAYEESKIADPKSGKKIHQRELYINALIILYPDKKQEIEKTFSETPVSDFLNPEMAKLLQVLTSSAGSRVHVLTYGEINFQRSKVEAVLDQLGVPLDILYTQVPKAEFFAHYLEEENPYLQPDNENVQSFVMIDDNPEELKHLVEFSKTQPFFVPIRLRNPSAKRSATEQKGEKAYEVSTHYARVLLEAQKALGSIRFYEGKRSSDSWKTENLTEVVQRNLDQSLEHTEGGILNIQSTSEGTLLVTRKGHEGEKETIEVAFDPNHNVVYEVTSDPHTFLYINGQKLFGKRKYFFGEEDYFNE